MPALRTDRPVVLVTGATGLQGKAVTRALLADGSWTVRAMTRDPRSAAARALSDAGAEIVAGDLADPATLPAALDRAEVVFAGACAPEFTDRAYERGRNLLGAIAAAGGGQHLVLTSLAGAPRDAARASAQPGRMERLERDAHEMGIPSIFVHVALPYERFLADLAPRRQRDGSWLLDLVPGEVPLPTVSLDDAATLIARVVARRGELTARTLAVVGDEMPVAGYASAMARLLAAPVHVRDGERARRLPVTSPEARELADLLDFIRRNTPRHEADIVGCRALHPAMQRFDPWLACHAGAFTRALAA